MVGLRPKPVLDDCRRCRLASRPSLETFQERLVARPAQDRAGQPVLQLEDVAKSFGPVVALRSASLEVRAGSIHALVGENGAGKSTLIKIVAGVHRRDSGV